MLGITKCFGTCISDIRYKRIIINAYSALGENLHFVISGYFVVADLVIRGVYCINIILFTDVLSLRIQ